MERKLQMVDLKAQMLDIRSEIEAGINEVLDSCAFINGPHVKSFTAGLEDYTGAQKVIPCANGTDALQIALMALNLQPGDEVIVPSFTYVATTEVIGLLNLVPRFAEVDEKTFNIDPTKLEGLVNEKTKAIMPVHLYGQSAPMEEIMAFAKKHNLKVIEDNAQAIGANYQFQDGTTRKTGTIGDIGCTSFYPSKNLGAYGDAGAIMSMDAALGERLQRIANHGQSKRYYHDDIGVNSRLDSFQAVVLNAKLKRLDDYGSARRKAADRYDALLQDVAQVETPYRAPYSSHVFHQYTLKVDQRDGLAAHLSAQSIPNMIYYPVPVHRQLAYQEWYRGEDMAVTDRLCERVISLPMHSHLTEDDQAFIVDQIKAFYA